ncbi:hypothetical protein B0H14DRAFT_2573797 [Mycena olivaceomarginata]|nr:hypothetical protein B0H14DRAFT_2573797 [Mycena olivaceomarginata]
MILLWKSEGLQFLERALLLARDTGDINGQPNILTNLALMKWRMGEYNTEQSLAKEAHILAKLCGNYYAQASALRIKAKCCIHLGNFHDSLFLLQTARELLRLCGMSGGALDSQIRINEANTHLEKSEYVEARSIYTKIAQIASQEQEPDNHAFALMGIGKIDVIIGANEQAVLQSLEMAKTIYVSLGDRFGGAVFYEMILADLNLRRGNILAAKNLFEKCLHWSWAKYSVISSYCLERMSNISRWRPANFHWASTSTMVYLAFAQKAKQKLAMYKAFCFLGDVFILNRDESTAESLFKVALEAFTYMDVHQSRADCMLRLGDIAWQQGDMTKAAVLWREARPLFERSQQTKDIGQIDARLAVHQLDQMAIIALLDVPVKHPESSVENTAKLQNRVHVALELLRQRIWIWI